MKLPKTYEPSQYEADIYALWEKSEAFVPKNREDDGYYSIVMPPPNANANLHIGYALTVALEDIPARYNRMKGRATLLLPGADHAGFETQSVYEKHLAKEGKSRFDFSREELYSQIWDFVAQNRQSFETQLRGLGASADWSRYTFTLDEKIVQTAYRTFKKMWDEGLIYRGERLVNYCTYHGTGFADIEVEHKEVKGNIWSLKYPLTDESGEVIVATTRPETMLGDVAVAVNPNDKRYTKLIGKTVRLPLTEREVPILADEFVDQAFGTGAVKITPAHDVNDFEVAGRHSLPMITVIGHDGKINHHAPKQYQGLTVAEARKQVVSDLEKQGFLKEVKDHVHSVGHCYKCGTVIEPLLKEQWFVDMKPLAEGAIKALESKKVAFYPDSKRDQLIKYLGGLRDWNISRQIAWGIPVPAFQNIEEPDEWIYDTRVDQETIVFGHKTYRRDPDVFDTWFSSSSWPYATLDHPDGADYNEFYPLNLMETGGEILYPWVSRMLMLGLYVTGDVPFKEVYIHGYVMAEDGSKMSKSIGNVIDPIPVIKQYGSDALRMGIIAGRSPAVNRGYDPRRVEEARNFANKLWNIARYIEGALGDKLQPGPKPGPQTLADHWILDRLNSATEQMNQHLDQYRFAEGYELLYHLVWDDVADWYIETSKANPNASVMAYTLETILKLAHPFAPFVTETIWQTLHPTDSSLLVTSKWPKNVKADAKQAKLFKEVMAIVSEIRHIKTTLKIKTGSLYYTDSKFIGENAELITKLAKLKAVTQVTDGKGLHLTQTKEICWLDVDRTTAQAFVNTLKSRETALISQIKNIQMRLDNENYRKKAPPHLIEESKSQLKLQNDELKSIQDQIKKYSSV